MSRSGYGVNPEKVVVIPNGVDTDLFTPVDKPITSNPYVLYSGRLDARKGVEDFVSCARYVCREKPEVKFVVAGDGPLSTNMKRWVHTANLAANFRFTGFVNQKTLLQYYREASVYVLPSFYEGMPLTLLEAMSCGTPCIATNVPGSSEVVINNVTGFLVSPGNPSQLAEATLKLLKDEQLRKEMGMKARKRVLEYYDWNITVDKLEGLYKQNLR